MKTRTKLKPGQNGTKKYAAQYGDALVCVRYRYDEQKRKQYQAVEKLPIFTPTLVLKCVNMPHITG